MGKKVIFYSAQDTNYIHYELLNYQEASVFLGGNTGNLVFTNAIQLYLDNAGIEYVITTNLNVLLNATNEEYSCCFTNCSNWLDPRNSEYLKFLTGIFSKSAIPVYFIGLGIQSKSQDSFWTSKEFDLVVKNFIKSVLNTKGAFGLRGFLTAAFFNKLGFKGDFTVTGCPSLYQNGRDFNIPTSKVSLEEFLPVFNGSDLLKNVKFSKNLKVYSKSTFIDQDEFLKIIKFPKEVNESEIRNLLSKSELVLQMIINSRIKIFTSFKEWSQFLENNKFNFSYGSRFHGNIAAMLNGIPSLIYSIDARVNELTDYFNIPYCNNHNENLYQKYLETDYTNFNKNFASLFDNFKYFIDSHSIPLKLPNQLLSINNTTPTKLNESNGEIIEIINDYLKFNATKILPFLDKRKQFLLSKRLLETIKSILKPAN